MLSLAPVSTAFLWGYDLPYNDVRRDSVRYDSPTLAGFILSASLANGDTVVPSGFNTKDAWDVALRYAGEIKEGGGWRFAAAISYRDEQQQLALPLALPLTRSTVIQGSASLMHMPTGLFVNAAAGKVNGDTLLSPLLNSTDFTNWQVQAGIEKKLFSIGATTVFIEYGHMKIDAENTKVKAPSSLTATASPTMIGGGVVQAIDGLAVDLYADYKRFDTSDPSITACSPPCATKTFDGFTTDVFMAGMRIKF